MKDKLAKRLAKHVEKGGLTMDDISCRFMVDEGATTLYGAFERLLKGGVSVNEITRIVDHQIKLVNDYAELISRGQFR